MTVSWYNNLTEMQEDDAYLQDVYATLRGELSPEAQERTHSIHVYPSKRCSYTIGKERVFVRVRDDNGNFVSECALRYILLHELAHTVNPTEGHDSSFRSWMRWVMQGVGDACPDQIPTDFNPCH